MTTFIYTFLFWAEDKKARFSYWTKFQTLPIDQGELLTTLVSLKAVSCSVAISPTVKPAISPTVKGSILDHIKIIVSSFGVF